jgi:hypothetical protein
VLVSAYDWALLNAYVCGVDVHRVCSLVVAIDNAVDVDVDNQYIAISALWESTAPFPWDATYE